MDTKDFLAGAKAAEAATTTLEARLKKMGDSMVDVGKKMSIGLTVPITAGFAFATKALMENQRSMAQTEAVIKSTGGAANVTAKHVADLATSIASMSGIDDDAVQAGENLLMTFTNVRNRMGQGNDVFDQATKSVANMATAMNNGAVPSMDQMHTAALQIGKALQSPVEGVTALQKAGVRLSETQRQNVAEMVAQGNSIGAQKIILGELTKEFGGSAAAAGQTFAGQMGIARTAVENASASMLQVAMPAITSLTQGITSIANVINGLPGPVKVGIDALLFLAAVAGPIVVIAGKLITSWGAIAGMFATHSAAAKAAAVATQETAAAATEATGGEAALAAETAALAEVTTAAAVQLAMLDEALVVLSEAVAPAETQLAMFAETEVAVGVGALGAAAGLEAEAVAAEAAAVGMETAEVASKGLMASLGPIGAVVVAAGLAFAAFSKKQHEAAGASADFKNAVKASTSVLNDAINTAIAASLDHDKLASAFAKSGVSGEMLGKAIATVSEASKDGGQYFLSNGDAVDKFSMALYEAKKNGKITADEMNKLGEAVRTMGKSLGEAQTKEEGIKGTQAALGIAVDGTTDAMAGQGQTVDEVAKAMETAADSTLKQAAAQAQAEQAALSLKGILWQLVDAQRAEKMATLEAKAEIISKNQAQQAATDAARAKERADRAVADAQLAVARSADEEAFAETNAANAVIAGTLGLQKAFNDLAYAQVQLDRAPEVQARREVDAANGVTKALINQRKATDDAAAAQLALDRLPQTYARAVADAADKVTSAYISQTKATNDVTLAQQHYNEVTSASHAQSLADAVTTAVINQTRAHDGITTAQRRAKEAGDDLKATQKEIKQVIAGNTEHLSDFAKTLQGTFKTALDATQRFKADTAISLGGLTQTLEANLTDFASWQDNLKKLAQGGHEGLAQELAKMGPSAANAVAQAVVASGPELDKLQSLYAQKTKFESSSSAMHAAKGMGDSGIDNEYLAGLKKQAKEEAQAKKDAQQDVTLAIIAARKADDDVNAALQTQANLYIDIQNAADAVQTAIIGTHTAANGVTDALQAQTDLLTGPNSFANQQQKLMDTLATSQIAVTDSANAVTDALNKQSDVMAKIGPYEDAAVQASRDYWGAQTALNDVEQSLSHSLQGQNDLMKKVGPVLDPVTKATWGLADAVSAQNNAMFGSQAAANAYQKAIGGIKGINEIQGVAEGNTQGILQQGRTSVMQQAEQGTATIIASRGHIPGEETKLQHLQALIISLNNILNSGQVPRNSPLFTMLQSDLANLNKGVPAGAPGLERGGAAMKGLAYIVGEKRPEVFVPNESGRVLPSLRDFMAQTKPYVPPGHSMEGGRGETHYHINMTVQGHVMADRDLVNTVHEGLKAKNRQSGTLGFT